MNLSEWFRQHEKPLSNIASGLSKQAVTVKFVPLPEHLGGQAYRREGEGIIELSEALDVPTAEDFFFHETVHFLLGHITREIPTDIPLNNQPVEELLAEIALTSADGAIVAAALADQIMRREREVEEYTPYLREFWLRTVGKPVFALFCASHD